MSTSETDSGKLELPASKGQVGPDEIPSPALRLDLARTQKSLRTLLGATLRTIEVQPVECPRGTNIPLVRYQLTKYVDEVRRAAVACIQQVYVRTQERPSIDELRTALTSLPQPEDPSNTLPREVRDAAYRVMIEGAIQALQEVPNVLEMQARWHEGMFPAENELEIISRRAVRLAGASEKQQYTWPHLRNLFETKTSMPFTAQEANKGGLVAKVNGGRAFLPKSELVWSHSVRGTPEDVDEVLRGLVGKTLTVQIIDLDQENKKLTVSEKAAEAKKNAETIEKLKIGDIKNGVVSNVTQYGFFVRFDGLEGLVHRSEISWAFKDGPIEDFEIGQEVRVIVVGINEENEISLSIKRLTQDPWETVEQRYQVGDKVQATVTKFDQMGARVKLEEGLAGLIHVSELTHPSQILNIGEVVDALILRLDTEKRRLGLSLRDYDAWQGIEKRHAVGQRVRGQVTRLDKHNVAVTLDDGVMGTIELDELAQTKVSHPAKVVKMGQYIDALIIALDTEKRRLALSLKQLGDPWKNIRERFPIGQVVSGLVRKILEKKQQVIVQLDRDIEGFLPLAEFADESGRPLAENVPIGRRIGVQIKTVSLVKRRINLAIPSDQPEQQEEIPAKEAVADTFEARSDQPLSDLPPIEPLQLPDDPSSELGQSGILLPTRWSGNLPEALQRSEKVLTRSYARKVAVGSTVAAVIRGFQDDNLARETLRQYRPWEGRIMNFIPHGTGIRTIEEYQRFWAAVGWVIETHVTDAGAREALCAELRKQREILEREMGVEPLAEIETAAPVDVQVDSQHEVKAELLLAVQQRWRATRTKLRQLLVAGQSLEHAAEVMEPEELRQLIEKLRQTEMIVTLGKQHLTSKPDDTDDK